MNYRNVGRSRERERELEDIKKSLNYDDIVSVENLLLAWQEFVRGKRNKPDVQLFASALIDNILQLHADFANKTYQHGGYYCFKISDPKPRDISKASVHDRLLHHAVYRILYPFFDRTFIADSYSCRDNKGTHKAINRLRSMYWQVSKNSTRTCWVLKLDIRKFFANIDHKILLGILKEYISDQDIMWLLEEIIDSFATDCFVSRQTNAWRKARPPRNDDPFLSLRAEADQEFTMAEAKQSQIGLPLGNLTSQLLVNIYMNKLDQFVKHQLKAKYYIRYADDFVILASCRDYLTMILPCIVVFLRDELRLFLHPNKIILKTFASGIDFLGWVHFPNHRVLRTATKKRTLKKISPINLQSYLGLLKHGSTYRIKNMIELSYE